MTPPSTEKEVYTLLGVWPLHCGHYSVVTTPWPLSCGHYAVATTRRGSGLKPP